MKTKSKNQKRENLIEAATLLIHQIGYGQTTLALVAKKAKVPLGNVYYYFKTKEELCTAVVNRRLLMYRSAYEQIDKLPNPKKRIETFLERARPRSAVLVKTGCPVGGLSYELNKLGGKLSKLNNSILLEGINWLEKQFSLMGRKKSAKLAEDLMLTFQGAILLSGVRNNENIIIRALDRLKADL